MIQHVELVRRLEQILMIVLTMHVYEQLRRLLEHAQRNRMTIQRRAGPPGCVKPASNQQLTAVGCDWCVDERFDVLERRVVAQVEKPAHPTLFHAAAKHVGW